MCGKFHHVLKSGPNTQVLLHPVVFDFPGLEAGKIGGVIPTTSNSSPNQPEEIPEASATQANDSIPQNEDRVLVK